MGRKKRRTSLVCTPARHTKALSATRQKQKEIPPYQKAEFFIGEKLTELLQKIGREIELERLSKGGLPDKVWLKQQFSVGVNDVTRVLERTAIFSQDEKVSMVSNGHRPPLASFQAILLACDCTDILISHIKSLANSRRVPIIFVNDGGYGSLRLGELVKVKTAIAIGVKAKGSRINKTVEEVVHSIGLEAVPEHDLGGTQQHY